MKKIKGFGTEAARMEKRRKSSILDLNLQLSELHDKHTRRLNRLKKQDQRILRSVERLRQRGLNEKARELEESQAALAGEIILLEEALMVVERAAQGVTSEQFKREYAKGVLGEDAKGALELYLRREYGVR